jgi:hypothetical protein
MTFLLHGNHDISIGLQHCSHRLLAAGHGSGILKAVCIMRIAPVVLLPGVVADADGDGDWRAF